MKKQNPLQKIAITKKKPTEKFILGDEGFWGTWISKLLFTIISVKVWGLFACTIVSSILLTQKLLTGTEWLTFNTTIWALIFGMKEVFRISEGKDKRDAALNQQKNDADQQLLLTQQQIQSGNIPRKDADGMEIVGEDPDNLE